MASNVTLGDMSSSKMGELRRRLLFLVMGLVVFRIGTHIPVPGIDASQLKNMIGGQSGGILNLFNMFSGGALERFSVFALGIMPYISASIVLQIITYVVPSLEQLKKEGEAGQRKISQYTRYGALGLAFFQSFGVAAFLENVPGLVYSPGLMFKFTTVLSLTTGSMFLMWLGEQMTERGIGNGTSIIIFAGIAAGLPASLGGLLELVSNKAMNPVLALFILVLAVLVTVFVVFVERGQRKVLVNYARRQVGNKVYGGQASHLPLRLNMAGVIPPIFASSVILMPATIAGWFGSSESMSWLKNFAAALVPGEPVYIALYAAAIIFFCFFYTGLVFNSRETADNLKKSGAFVPGIRPGENTARYLDKVLMRLTFVGAIYITAVCLMPEFVRMRFSSVPFNFGGTSLLIVVGVTMELMAQIQNYLMSQQYDSLMKKANFKQPR